MARSFVPIIRAAFDPVLIPHGFAVEREAAHDEHGTGADIVWYRAGERTVSVTYHAAGDWWCEVSIKGYGAPESVSDPEAFVHGFKDGIVPHFATNDPVKFEREARRCAEQLVSACGEFLSGDVAAFRERYAELLRVQAIRNEALTRWSARDIEGMERWYTLIEGYLKRDERARLADARMELRRAAYRAPPPTKR